jgi:hypothetical protein
VDEREKLHQILADVQRLSDEHWNALTEACRLMDLKAWVGPTARDFEREQQGHHRRLRAALQQSVELVRQKLTHTPSPTS